MSQRGGDAVGSEATHPRSPRRFVMAVVALCVIGALLFVPWVLNAHSAGDKKGD